MNALSSIVFPVGNSIFDVERIMSRPIPIASGLTDIEIGLRQEYVMLDTETLFVSYPRQEFDLTKVAPALDDWRRRLQAEAPGATGSKTLFTAPDKSVGGAVHFEPLQEWEGYVTEIENGRFNARLIDKTAGDTVESEETYFSLSDDVSPFDRELVEVGAIFWWSIGYEKNSSGSVKKVSSVVFRRLPKWTQEEIDASSIRAKALINSIEWL